MIMNLIQMKKAVEHGDSGNIKDVFWVGLKLLYISYIHVYTVYVYISLRA